MKKYIKEILQVIGWKWTITIIVLTIVGTILSPIVLIYALNLLGFSVVYSWETWFAGLLLVVLFGRSS